MALTKENIVLTTEDNFPATGKMASAAKNGEPAEWQSVETVVAPEKTCTGGGIVVSSGE